MKAAENNLGDRVKQVRESAGLNQTDFAALLGVKQSFLSAVERGVRKSPKAWEVVLSKEFGVSQEYLKTGVITNSDTWYLVPPNGPLSSPSKQKVQKGGTIPKNIKKASDSPLEAENEQLTPEEKKRHEASERFYHRRITESRLYKGYPEAESEGLAEALALSRIGSDSDRILKHLHNTAHDRIDQVLDRVADGSLPMAAAAAEIQKITAPLDEIKDYFTAIETAIVEMARAAIEVMPEVYNVVGYHIHEALSIEPDNRLSVHS